MFATLTQGTGDEAAGRRGDVVVAGHRRQLRPGTLSGVDEALELGGLADEAILESALLSKHA